MNQFWPFFLTGLIPTVTSIALHYGLRREIGGLHREIGSLRDEMRAGFLDIKNQIAHLIDLHINHAERIRVLEEKTKKL